MLSGAACHGEDGAAMGDAGVHLAQGPHEHHLRASGPGEGGSGRGGTRGVHLI